MTDDAARARALRHLVVCANPSPASFDHAIVAAYAETVEGHGQEVVVRDLYAIGFDPVLRPDERPIGADVTVELDALAAADILVLVYPIWYGLPPAILKGYVDRVLGANHPVDRVAAGQAQPVVAGKPLLSFSTSGLARSWLHEREQDSLIKVFNVYLARAFGMKQSEHVTIDAVTRAMDPRAAAKTLDRVRTVATRTCATLAGHPPLRWEA